MRIDLSTDAPALPCQGPAADQPRSRAGWLGRVIIPFTVAIGFMMEQLDGTIITTALPRMAKDFHTSPVTLNVGITAYLLSVALFIPLSGWIADRWGMRRTYICALAVFITGSMLCGLATNIVSFAAMRVLQGMGGAMMTPVGRLILLRSFEKSELVTAMTFMTVPVVIGPMLGPALGGLLTQYLSWHWIFYANLPIGLGGIMLTWAKVDEFRPAGVAAFDWGGFFVCGVALVTIQCGLQALGLPSALVVTGLLLILTGAAILTVFARRRQTHPYPPLDLSLFRIRSFRVGVIFGGINRIGLNSIGFLLPLLLQVGFGFSPTHSGLLTLTSSFGTVIIRPLAGLLLRNYGFGRLLAVNSVVAAMLILPLTLLRPQTPSAVIIGLVVGVGIARGLQFTTLNTLIFSDIPAARLSRSTSLSGMAQQLSMGFGVSFSAAMLQVIAGPGALPSPEVFRIVLVCVALITLSAGPAFLMLHAEDGADVSGYKPVE
jgi:EmrB/QacA subfamily drug resistance transporter